MLIFKFSGHLRRYFRQVELNVETPAQGLRLLIAQSQEFKKAFLSSKVNLRVAGEDVSEQSVKWHMDRRLDNGSTVLFVPAVEGAVVGAIIIAVLSVAYSVYSAHNMKTKTSAEAAETNTITNNSFTSAENRVGQGKPVPILLGEMLVGSNVISLGIDTSNTDNWDEIIS
ncbi:tail assembly protein [Erwinia billingiae]|uniref:tail assembly protein n=1 Tax=Erwinia billingiae TaxID=182337 RepID=UPI0030CB674F